MRTTKWMKSVMAASVLMMTPLAAQALDVGQLIMDVERVSFTNDRGAILGRDIYVGIGDNSQVASRQKMGNNRAVNIDVSRSKAGQIQLDAGFANIIWKDVPKWLTSEIDVVGRNLFVNIGRMKKQEITAESIDITKPRLGMLRLRGLNIQCFSNNGDRLSFEGILPNCLERAQITSREADIPELTKYAQLMLSESEEASGQKNLGKGLEISLNNGSLELLLNVALKMNLNIRVMVKGLIKYDEKKNVVHITLQKAILNRLDVSALALPVIKLILNTEEVQIQGNTLSMKL